VGVFTRWIGLVHEILDHSDACLVIQCLNALLDRADSSHPILCAVKRESLFAEVDI